MQTPDISYISLFLCSLLLIIPFVVSIILKLGLVKDTATSVLRMAAQLVLIGIFLKYLFELNNPLLNIGWLVVMVIVATFNIIRKVKVNMKVFLMPTLFSLIVATFFIVLYFNVFVIRLSDITDARFLIVIGGMLLGNSLRGDIIGLDNFYKAIKRNEQRRLYALASGATLFESLIPYFRESLIAALQPTIATMATMGIVFLPGMMTGQILGGVSPVLAIKYQIAIMIAIFTATTIAVNVTIVLTMRTCFDAYGMLRGKIFRY
jgi:putative ABC transport system permease protein